MRKTRLPAPVRPFHSKLLTLLALLALATFLTPKVHAGNAKTTLLLAGACDKCPERRVTLYDFDVSAPRPDSLGDIGNWYSLSFAAPGAGAAIAAGAQCASFIDAAFYRDTTGVPSSSLKVGIDQPNTAPSGSMKGMDYLLTGTVQPDGAGYKLTMDLQTACDRKSVASASGHFDRADQASAYAAELARQKFIPLSQVIRDYEREVRSGNTEVSIGGNNATLTVDPQRRKAKPGETVPVTLTLIDCDGEPLAGRTLSFTGKGNNMAPPSSNGAFAVAQAVTGNDGKVTVDFIVGSAKGTAVARAYCFHKTPFGCEAVAVDEAAIEVDGAAGFYQVKYMYEEYYDQETTYEENPTPTWTKKTRRTDTRRLFISGSAVIKNTGSQLGGALIELEGAGLDGGLSNGSYQQSINVRASEHYSDANATIRSGSFEDRNSEGAPYRTETEQPDIFVSLDPGDLGESSQFTFTVPFALHGTIIGHGFESITGKGYSHDTTYSVDDVDSSTTHYSPGVKIINRYTSADSAIHIRGSMDTTWSSEDATTRTTTHERGSLEATLTPIAVRPKPDGIRPARTVSRRQERIRVLNNGSRIALRVQDLAPDTRVQVGLYTLGGKAVSVLHDAPRGSAREITLALDPQAMDAAAGLQVIVFRAGALRESRVLYLNHK